LIEHSSFERFDVSGYVREFRHAVILAGVPSPKRLISTLTRPRPT